jgi:hypothetical protein
MTSHTYTVGDPLRPPETDEFPSAEWRAGWNDGFENARSQIDALDAADEDRPAPVAPAAWLALGACLGAVGTVLALLAVREVWG